MGGNDVDMNGTDNTEAELDEMKRRLKEMEDEATALREMQAKVEHEMASAQIRLKQTKRKSIPDQFLWAMPAQKRSFFLFDATWFGICVGSGLFMHSRGSTAAFQSCGTVNRVTILTDKYGQPKGYAYVGFLEPEAVQEAILLNKYELHGRQLKVTAKRTNVPVMKQYHPCQPNQFMGARYEVSYMPSFYTPYGYGKVPRFRAAVRLSPYF